MLDSFEEWKFLAGLGIFLFGMFTMEESIKRLSGRSLRTLIRRSTGTPLKGLVTGLASTALLQSSSAVSLMVLAFVGAGLLSLISAVAVIMGAMVGTTVTAWIVALFGFKFKIDALALPLIGLGGLGLIVLGGFPRQVPISKLLAAFGFLFLGLEFMKSSVEDLATAIDLSVLPQLGLWVYILAGLVLTAAMQSSSAAIAVILTALYSDLIDFRQGAGLVIGANVGTTVTILLGAIGGTPVKKQAALSSLAFNVGTALVAWPALPLLIWLVDYVFGLGDNAVLGIGLFHTLFNVLGVVLFFPFLPTLVGLLQRLVPEKQAVLTRYIHNTNPQVPEAAIEALRREIGRQLSLSVRYITARYRLRPSQKAKPTGEPGNRSKPTNELTYRDVGRLHAEIFAFYARMQGQEINEMEARQLEPAIRTSRNIMNATRNLYELRAELDDFGRDDQSFMLEAYRQFRERLGRLADVVDRVTREGETEYPSGLLERFVQSVEEGDRHFIQSCARAVARGTIPEEGVTRLLMANRSFTQANRMLAQSMDTLAKQGGPEQKTVSESPAP